MSLLFEATMIFLSYTNHLCLRVSLSKDLFHIGNEIPKFQPPKYRFQEVAGVTKLYFIMHSTPAYSPAFTSVSSCCTMGRAAMDSPETTS